MDLLAMLGKSSTDPVDISSQAALAPHPTMEQEESSDTHFMVMWLVNPFVLCCWIRELESIVIMSVL
jgi:hypothetical protein